MIAIVAHDAGAANHIFAWLKTGYLDKGQVCVCLSGPAAVAYSKQAPKFRNYTLAEVMQDADLLISGTGWASDLEHEARKIAHRLSIESVAVIDHWTNYRERFIRGQETVLPDRVWVTDKYAYRLVEKDLPEVIVEQKTNTFLMQQVNEIKNHHAKTVTENSVLFLMEPIRKSWGNSELPGEIQTFEYFIKHKTLLGLPADVSITIKPHPSDPLGKYDSLLEQFPSLTLCIDEHSSLVDLIASASVVVGCQTYAMIIALHAGKKVISALPPYAPRCMLPQLDIVHLSELVCKQ